VNEGMLAIINNLKIPLGIIASLILLGESTDYLRLVVGFGLMVGAAYLCEGPATYPQAVRYSRVGFACRAGATREPLP